MAKKISLLLAAMAVLAFAVPALASASTGLTSPSGTFVAKGTLVRGTGVPGTVKITSTKLGTLKCENVTLNGKVTKNSESEGVEGVGSGESTATSCTTPSGASFTVTEIVLNNIKSPVSTPGAGTASFSFTANLPGGQVCKYSATEAPGTYTANTSTIKLEKSPITTTGTNCGTSTLDGEFKLEVSATSAAILIM